MRLMRFLVGLAVVIMAATVVMYVVSFWTGETLGGPVYSTRLALVLILLAVLILLLPRLDRGTLPWRLWLWTTIAMIINTIPITLEMINAYAGRNVFSPDLIFLFYLCTFIPVLVVVGVLYFGFRKQGFEFSHESLRMLPSMLIIVGVVVVVLIVPMAISGGDLGVKISDIFALVVQISALCLVSFMAITIGKGEAGRPYLFLSMALACIIVQTILTAHIRLVGIMSTTELADIFLHIGYTLLIFAAYFQYEMTVPAAIKS